MVKKETMKRTYATLQEILGQAEAWDEAIAVVGSQAGALRQLWQAGWYDHVIFTGCGSTYYLSLAAAALFQEATGLSARGVPAGELLLYPRTAYADTGRPLLVAVSRSGTTTETVEALRRFKNTGRGDAIVLTNYPDSPLAALGDLTLGLAKGQEQSVAQTRSFASMYVAATATTAVLGGRIDLLTEMQGLSRVGQRLLADYAGQAQSLGGDLTLDRFYVLGSGPRFGLACEVNLKLKEMTLTHSEAFHFLEFRHGPMSMVGETTVVIGLLSETNRAHEQVVLQEMGRLGGRILSIGEWDTDVAFQSGLPEAIRNVLYLPILQLMAYHRATAKGLDPDHPRNLTAVVELAL